MNQLLHLGDLSSLLGPPDHIPEGARQVSMRVWGGGLGTFWQKGALIGVQWLHLPDWGHDNNLGVRSKSWRCPEAVAKQWFALISMHAKIPSHAVS